MEARSISMLVCALSLLVSLRAAAEAPDAPASAAGAHAWRVSLSAGVARYTPSYSNIPRGNSESVSTPAGEASIGRRLSSRLSVNVSGTWSASDESRWDSESVGGRALIPTPSFSSWLVTLRTPLYEGRAVPFAAVGGGFTRFGAVDEIIRFEWPSSEEDIRVEIPARTDATLVFDLGVAIPWAERWETEAAYRLLSIFSDDRVNTIDHLSVTGTVRF